MKAKLLYLASLILAMRSSASIETRKEIVCKLITLGELNPTVADVGACLSDCAALSSKAGEWHLAAVLRRAQDEIIHALLPEPGHNIRKIFRRKRNQYA